MQCDQGFLNELLFHFYQVKNIKVKTTTDDHLLLWKDVDQTRGGELFIKQLDTQLKAKLITIQREVIKFCPDFGYFDTFKNLKELKIQLSSTKLTNFNKILSKLKKLDISVENGDLPIFNE